MVEEVTSLKKDFKQKENKYLEEFLDMKALKEKVEDKLYKQDQSLQTVHMLCKPKPYYDDSEQKYTRIDENGVAFNVTVVSTSSVLILERDTQEQNFVSVEEVGNKW
ncbi:retrovirus-related pol polyprotein from transposon TNT 1-94 [Tanacetum coccineum]